MIYLSTFFWCTSNILKWNYVRTLHRVKKCKLPVKQFQQLPISNRLAKFMEMSSSILQYSQGQNLNLNPLCSLHQALWGRSWQICHIPLVLFLQSGILVCLQPRFPWVFSMMMKHSEPADEKVLEWLLEYGELRRFKLELKSRIFESLFKAI